MVKKTYIQPMTSFKMLEVSNILADSVTIGDDLTTGEHEGRSKNNIWDDED